MKVEILISIPDTKWFDNCTMVFKTLRVGFPTAKLHVTINGVGRQADQYEASGMASAVANEVWMEGAELHHGEWVRRVLENAEGPTVLLDGDIHFWKSCEDWNFNALMAGYYVPEIFNVWSQCRSVARLHTSFLWFKDPAALRREIGRVYQRNDAYSPCNPYMPETRFINGEPIFWDTCANLYNMIGGQHFTDAHTACYEHLNSAGFVDKVAGLMGGKTGEDFMRFHTLAPNNPELLRTFGWPMLKHYYRQKHIEALVLRARFRDVDRMETV